VRLFKLINKEREGEKIKWAFNYMISFFIQKRKISLGMNNQTIFMLIWVGLLSDFLIKISSSDTLAELNSIYFGYILLGNLILRSQIFQEYNLQFFEYV